jgi:5-methylcytosine-specific restriction endonuclease McrA
MRRPARTAVPSLDPNRGEPVTVPAAVRAAVNRRADGRCEDCGERVPLELHHLRYLKVVVPGDGPWDIDGYEEPDDLAALCRDCHHRRHVDPNGEFWRDPEEMEVAWAGFSEAVDDYWTARIRQQGA